MKWGLRGRLMAALVGVALLSLGCAAVTYEAFAGSGFDELVVSEARVGFISDVTAYYQLQGTLDGIDRFFQQRGPAGRPGVGIALDAPASQPAPQPSQVGGTQAPPPPPSGPPPLGALPFILVDANGKVVMPVAGFHLGDIASADQIARGVPIRLNGKIIGTVLPTPLALPFTNAEAIYLQETRLALAFAAAAGVLAAAVVGVLLARGISQPIRQMTDAVLGLARDESANLAVKGSDELSELARAFNQMSAEVVAVNAARRQMIADTAHELRNPLSTIKGYIEAFRDGDLDPTKDRLDAVYGQTERLERIIEDLRTVSLGNAGRLSLTLAEVDVEAVIRGVAENCASRAAARGVAMTWHVEAGLEPAWGNQDAVVQILDQFASNALRHTPGGGEVNLIGRLDDDAIVIEVQDNGEGIPAQDLPFVFDPLYRAGSPEHRDGTGFGLGLTVVKALTNAQGGTVGVESVAGKSTTFSLRLPRSTMRPNLTEHPSTPLARSGSGTPDEAAGTAAHEALLDERLELERSRLKSRLVIAGFPAALVLFFGRSALVSAGTVLVIMVVRFALIQCLTIFWPNVVRTRQVWLRLFDITCIFLALYAIHSFALSRQGSVSPVLESVYLLIIIATAATEGRSAVTITTLAALAAILLDRIVLSLQGLLPAGAWHSSATILDLATYAAVLGITASTVIFLVRVSGEGAVKRQQELAAEASARNEELRQTLDELTRTGESLRARRQMTADIGHELRNPLTTIGGYVQAFRDGDIEPTPQRLDAIYRETKRLDRIIGDLRTISLADVGGLSLSLRPMSASDVLNGTARNFAVLAGQKQIALSCDIQGELGEIDGDPERLGQVFSNLVSNALRHTPEGGEVRLVGFLDEAAVVLAVEDTGEGIAREELPFVFDRYYRAGSTPERDAAGSGLGLAIVKALVTAHQGDIEVQSVVGSGTTFTIRLPRIPERSIVLATA